MLRATQEWSQIRRVSRHNDIPIYLSASDVGDWAIVKPTTSIGNWQRIIRFTDCSIVEVIRRSGVESDDDCHIQCFENWALPRRILGPN
jgi:hypothetical protein